METNELIKIWKTLAENQLIDKELAKDNILQMIRKKGIGILQKLKHNVKKEIIVDIITSCIVTLIIIGVFIFQKTQPIEKRAHIVLFIILAYFIYKLYKDFVKYNMLNETKLTDNIKNSTLHSYSNFKKLVKQDMIIAISFIVSINLYAIYIYYKAFGDYSRIDFTYMNIQSIGFVLLIFLLLSLILTPYLIIHFFNRKYRSVINDFESTIKELNSEL